MTRALLAGVALALIITGPAFAQSTPDKIPGVGSSYPNPNIAGGDKWTPIIDQWDAITKYKLDVGSSTVPAVMSGKLLLFPSATSSAGLNLGVGAAPTSPINGDMWATSLGVYTQVNGITVGPFGSGGGGTGCTTGGSANNLLTANGAAGCTTVTVSSLVNGALSLGASATPGSVAMGNATSGTITLQPVTGALGAVTVSLPAATDTLVGKATTDTLTNKTITGGSNTISAIALTSLATQAANTVVGNATAGAASPTALAIPSCSTTASAVSWTTSTGFGCNTTINAGTLGGATFAAPGAIGGTTASTGKFTTLTDTALATAGVTTNTAAGLLGTVAYAVAADVQTGTDTTKPVTANALSLAQAFQTLAQVTGNVAWNMQSGYNASITLTASGWAISAPTNITAGQTYTLLVVQDGTGSRTVTWASAFDFGTAGAPTLTTTLNKTDMVTCLAVATAGTAAANNLYCATNKGF